MRGLIVAVLAAGLLGLVSVAPAGSHGSLSVSLSPQSDTNLVGTQHCVTATVSDQSGGPQAGFTVSFQVAGANPTVGSQLTNASGQAQFCYTGQNTGTDTITASVESEFGSGSDTASKTWVAATNISLAPSSATNTVGTQHCVTATVRDQFGAPLSGIVVSFQVTGAHSAQGSGSTDANGQVQACYTGQNVGNDTITATAGALSASASKTWVAVSTVATVALGPSTATHTVGAQACVTATVSDQFGTRLSGIGVSFLVSGANSAQGFQTTNTNGQAVFCYTAQNVGNDTISATADTQSATASKSWVAVRPGPPTLGKNVNVAVVNGRVLVKVPGGALARGGGGGGFVPLEQARQIPVGSLLNTRRGKVALTSARDRQGHTQRGVFGGGIFKVRQGRRSGGLTELRLRSGDFGPCARSRSGATAARGGKQRIRHISASSRRGRFRTRGRFSASTVRGTVWGTIDRCDGTVTWVRKGTVVVRDLVRHRTVIVHAHDTYLAKAPGRA